MVVFFFAVAWIMAIDGGEYVPAAPFSLVCTSIASLPCYQSFTPTYDRCAGLWTSSVLGHLWLEKVDYSRSLTVIWGSKVNKGCHLVSRPPVSGDVVVLEPIRIQENR